MATLIVQDVEQHITDALKARADSRGKDVEVEHLRILKEALIKPTRKTFAEAIMSIPPAGADSDFSRIQN